MWATRPSLIHTTVAPDRMVICAGVNSKSRIATTTVSAALATAGPSAVADPLPKYRLNVKGTVNSNPYRVLGPPRDEPSRVAVLVLEAWMESECGV